MGPIVAAGIGLGLKGLGKLFGGKAKKKQNDNQRNATIAGLTIQQKQAEDKRRARLALANSLLGSVPGTTAGGGVNTNVALDPEMVKQLSLERTYDFGSAVPDANAGAGSAFLSGLFGGAGDLATAAFGGGANGVGAGAAAAGGPIVDGLSLEDLLKLQRTQSTSNGGGLALADDWSE
jgi:hypothetical protein